MIMLATRAVEHDFQLAQAADAAILGGQHGQQMIPTGKTFAPLVRLVSSHAIAHQVARQEFQYLAENTTVEHGVGPVTEFKSRNSNSSKTRGQLRLSKWNH